MTPAFEPNDVQRDVIAAEDPILVVTGGAGTGKTTTAAFAARAHLERRDPLRLGVDRSLRRADSPPPDRVLFLSFSRASVARIAERSGAILGPYRERVEITTFHALAWRLIRSFGSLIDLPKPFLMSKAQSMLFTSTGSLLYKDLVPKALLLLDIPVVRDHVRARWSLIISDEFQDTDDRQYELLQALSVNARQILLGDPNQCIYAGLPDAVGVTPTRLADVLRLPGARWIELPEASYRDPSGVIPAAAAAIRRREFFGAAVAEALRTSRLQVFTDGELAHEAESVAGVVQALRELGLSVAVFSHHNDALAKLSDQLRDAGIDHELVGLSESVASALDAQVVMAQYAHGLVEWQVVLQYLAIFVVSAVRGSRVPPLAQQILGTTEGSPTLARRLTDLELRLQGLDPAAALLEAAQAHAAIGLPNKSSAWARAAKMLMPMLAASSRGPRGQRPTNAGVLASLDKRIEDQRAAMLTEDTVESDAVVQLMNLHQTKGRESDATVVVLRSTDFFGHERTEPFEDGSRLLYVVFSRAKLKVVVLIFGHGLNDLVAPLARLAG